MGFISSLASAAIKTALTPIAIAKDAVNVAIGAEVNSTKELLESASKDIDEATKDF